MTKVTPVGPEVARGPSAEDLAPWIAAANRALSVRWTDYDRSNGRSLDVTELGGFETARALIPVFVARGWTVTLVSDQREGSTLRFIPATVRKD